MSTSSTSHPANRKIADKPSFRRAGPGNKRRHLGDFPASATLAQHPGGARSSLGAPEPGPHPPPPKGARTKTGVARPSPFRGPCPSGCPWGSP
eukprot:214179-Alexandrium_andersonii.AAC.1